MNHTTDTTPQGQATSRRTLLTAGGAGLAATALLAACSNSDAITEPGLSGSPVSSTLVPPTVPEREPTPAELQADLDMLATANSLELLAVEVYTRFPFDDPDLAAAADRFAADHTAAADLFAAEVEGHEGVGEPNEYLLTNTVEPVARLLDEDAPIADLAAGVERAIAATYVNAVGTLIEPQWRQTMAEHGAAAARRAAVLGNGGEGSNPTAALLPMTDLISGEAYLTTATAEELAAEAEEATESEIPEEGEAPAEGGAAAESE